MSQHTAQSRRHGTHPHLSWILSLEPFLDPRCAGYAHVQGRRCSIEIDPVYQNAAVMLLEIATTDFYDGLCIDDLLEELARHFLCTRLHQYQAPRLVERWKRELDALREEWGVETGMRNGTRMAPIVDLDYSPFERPILDGLGREYGGRDEDRYEHDYGNGQYLDLGFEYVQESRCARIRRRIRDFFERLKDIQLIPRICSGSEVPDVDEIRESVHRDPFDNIHYRNDYNYSGYEDMYGPTEVQVQDDENAPAELEVEDDELAYGSRQTHTADPDTHAARQPIEGDCGICLHVLSEQAPHYTIPGIDMTQEINRSLDAAYSWSSDQAWGWRDTAGREYAYYPEGMDPLEEEEEEEDGIGMAGREYRRRYAARLDAIPESKAEEGETASDSATDATNPDLTWCRAECGVNYHKSCIDHWLATAGNRFDPPTCPTCRRDWIDFRGVAYYLVR